MARVTFSLPNELKAKIAQLAKKDKRTTTNYTKRVLDTWAESQREKK